MERMRRIFIEERGSAVLLALGFMIFLLAMGGIAIDVAYEMSATGEAQRSMEAAALAGAGKLGFNNTVFPAVRAAAVQYGSLNPYHNAAANPITLNPNPTNAPNGNVVLGEWDGTTNTFTPSLNGNTVNAVQCQWSGTVQTSFLRVLGFQTLPISAQAIAIANPPANPPPVGCMFPIGLSSCFFGGNTSLGCGAMVSFISSSNNSAVGANSSAWISMLPTCATANGGACSNNVNTPQTTTAINAAAGVGGAACPQSPLVAGQSQVATTNGMAASVYNNTLIPNFIQKYNASPTYTVLDANGAPSYTGQGWQVYVPVIQTPGGCPPGAINGDLSVVGFTRFVITQVRNNNGECAVANHYPGNPWDSMCFTNKNGTATSVSQVNQGSRGVYGYYDCTYIPGPPIPTPVPRTALATRLRLVKMY